MEKHKSTLIYDSTREQLCNNLAQLQRLQEEGIHVGNLPQEDWNRLVELIENRDEKRLDKLREELHDKIVMEEWTKDKNEQGTRLSR